MRLFLFHCARSLGMRYRTYQRGVGNFPWGTGRIGSAAHTSGQYHVHQVPNLNMGTQIRRFHGVTPLVPFQGLEPPRKFETSIFNGEVISVADRSECIVRGGRHLFSAMVKALKDIKQIGVIGWGSQGPAQAQNLRDSLVGSGIKVKVGLREGSTSVTDAAKCGFDHESGTLGETYAVIQESDLVLLLIADSAMVDVHEKVFSCMKPQSYLGLSHGFLLSYMNCHNKTFPTDINVIAVCPKGMGPSVRRLYEQGNATSGAGINCSFAVHQDITGNSTDVAIAWAIGLGSPCTFQTTLEAEYKSDIFGERGILLGACHAICEVLYRHFIRHGARPEDAYRQSAECITGPISSLISQGGLMSVYEAVSDKPEFERAYSAAYYSAAEILLECYEEVSSGREVQSVVDHCRRLGAFPMRKIDSTPMWKTAATVRATRESDWPPVNATTAGVYLATMVAQCDVLIEAGHAYSEVANESIIECVESLNPYMHHRGVAYMVDNCSTTARLGSRKWAPRFDYLFEQQTIPNLNQPVNMPLITRFKTHKIHEVLRSCSALRPDVNLIPLDTAAGEMRSTLYG